MNPQNMTDAELAQYAWTLMGSAGLPLDFQKELLRRLELRVDADAKT